jgi:hypothetical protein
MQEQCLLMNTSFDMHCMHCCCIARVLGCAYMHCYMSYVYTITHGLSTELVHICICLSQICRGFVYCNSQICAFYEYINA